MTLTCPHCVGMRLTHAIVRGGCCLCEGQRTINPALAAVWAWDYVEPDGTKCDCAACLILRAQFDALCRVTQTRRTYYPRPDLYNRGVRRPWYLEVETPCSPQSF